jgi:hypothetical protein
MSFSDMARRVGKLAIDHSPTILTSVGVVGAITTAYLAGKASFEASDMIRLKEGLDYRSEEDRREPREVMKDRLQLVWKLYIPAIGVGTATVICVIGANRIGSKRAAALAAATTIIERSYDEYKDKVIEKFGEKKEEAVRAEIAQDRLDKTYLDDVELVNALEGELVHDKFSDRYFRNTYEGIKGAENQLNHTLIHDNFATLDDLYVQLNIPPVAYGHAVGWNSDRLLEIKITTGMAPGDKPCLVIDFKPEPTPDYGRFR